MHAGHHIILDLYHCSDSAIRDEDLILQAFQHAIQLSQVTAIDTLHHKFSPHGVTAIALLAESHMSIHTWPEHGYAAIDIYTCGDNLNSELALQHMASVLEPQTYRTRRLERPIIPAPPQQAFVDSQPEQSFSHCDWQSASESSPIMFHAH